MELLPSWSFAIGRLFLTLPADQPIDLSNSAPSEALLLANRHCSWRGHAGMCYNPAMATEAETTKSLPTVVPVNDETRAILDYAASPEGQAKIEQARQELRDGRGITVTDSYFEDLNQRVDERMAQGRTAKA